MSMVGGGVCALRVFFCERHHQKYCLTLHGIEGPACSTWFTTFGQQMFTPLIPRPNWNSFFSSLSLVFSKFKCDFAALKEVLQRVSVITKGSTHQPCIL